MPARSVLAGALLVVVLLPLVAWAEEPAPRSSPAQAYADKVASLPPPTDEQAFAFDGVLRINGHRAGHATLSAKPSGEGEDRGWQLYEQIVIKPDALPRVETSAVRFDRRLGLIDGFITSNKPGDGGIRWQKTGTGFRGTRVIEKGEVKEEVVRQFEHAGSALTTLVGTALFARLALPDKAVYETTIFEVEAGMKGKKALEAVTFTVLGEQEREGRKLLGVRAMKGPQILEMWFRPAGRELVGLSIVEGATRVEILAGDEWTLPSRDPVTAAQRAALALATGNVDLLDDVIHWPRLHARVVAAQPADATGKQATVGAFREQVVAQWQKALPKNAPDMIRGVLPMLKAQLKRTDLPDGSVHIVYPPIFKNLKLTLAEDYGFWHLVALPAAETAPPPASRK